MTGIATSLNSSLPIKDGTYTFKSSGDLVYDAGSGKFYATSLQQQGNPNEQNSKDDLWSFNLNGQSARLIGSTNVSDSMTGLTIENGNLYGYNGYPMGPVRRYLINSTRGAASPNPNPNTVNTAAAAFKNGYFSGTANDPRASVPEPSSMFGTLAFGALGAGYLLKRQLKKQKSIKSIA